MRKLRYINTLTTCFLIGVLANFELISCHKGLEGFAHHALD